jgi:hypothetical protein
VLLVVAVSFAVVLVSVLDCCGSLMPIGADACELCDVSFDVLSE